MRLSRTSPAAHGSTWADYPALLPDLPTRSSPVGPRPASFLPTSSPFVPGTPRATLGFPGPSLGRWFEIRGQPGRSAAARSTNWERASIRRCPHTANWSFHGTREACELARWMPSSTSRKSAELPEPGNCWPQATRARISHAFQAKGHDSLGGASSCLGNTNQSWQRPSVTTPTSPAPAPPRIMGCGYGRHPISTIWPATTGTVSASSDTEPTGSIPIPLSPLPPSRTSCCTQWRAWNHPHQRQSQHRRFACTVCHWNY